MVPNRFVAGIFGVCLSASVLAPVVEARSLGSVEGMPFFGRPYPYGYVYHRPPAECYDIRPVDTPDGPKLMLTWICDVPVSARY